MVNVNENVKGSCRWLKNRAVQLNLFDSDRSRSDNFHLRTAIISTRIYILLLIFIVTILVVCRALDNQTESTTIRSPSQATYGDLYNKYPTTLTCRCKQTAIPFSTFISVSTEYHPICSSFFVSDGWIKQLFHVNSTFYIQIDFRSLASGHFQLLSSLCSLIKRTIRDALDDFRSSTLLTVNVLSAKSLKIQSEARSLFVRTSSADDVRRLIKLIQNTTHINFLQTALQTTGINSLYIYPDGQVASGIYDGCFIRIDGTKCCCSVDSCSTPASFFDLYTYETNGTYVSPKPSIANISGFMVGCYAMESLLQSTLECLFGQVCTKTLLRFFPSDDATSANVLRINQTKFSTKTTIETLINELFIEQWSTVSSFSAYYKQCAPISCTYTFVRYGKIVYALTTFIGLYGGLTVILRLCVPHAIHWYRTRVNRPMRTTTHTSVPNRLQTSWRRMKFNVSQLNLYKSNTSNTEPYDLMTAKISTRIYLLFLWLSITILIIFSSLQMEIQNIIVENPSRETFEHLHNIYLTTLRCPCNQIAINYGLFVSLLPKYHPVCSSQYISPEWINSIEGTVNPNFVYTHEDFHMVGQAFFSTISVLCTMAQSTVESAWFNFNHSALLTDHVLSNEELMMRATAILDQFESNTINEYKRLLSIIRLHAKTMFSTKRSNADLYSNQLIDENIDKRERVDFQSVAMRYGNCLCTLNDECQQQVAMYSNGNKDTYEWKFFIPNFFVGCFVMQSVLQSSLECFFNQTCLDAIQTEIISYKSINVSILDINATRFSPETLINTLVNSLIIEDWGRAIQYDQYYEQCTPRLCSYAIFFRKNALYIFTKLISVIGGLTVGLKMIVPLIVKRIRKCLRPAIETNHPKSHRLLKDRMRSVWYKFKTKILQINIFTKEVTVDKHRHYTGIIATRIYFLLIILSITILIIYTSVEIPRQHITISEPSQAKFEHLVSNPRYISTLECPCRYIGIPYSTFISIIPQFHQLCSSDFVRMSSPWLNALYFRGASLKYPYNDFRIFVVSEFQTLFGLCALANETFTDALTLFMSNTFVSVQVQTRETIEKHANESFFRFRLSTPRTFVRMLDYIRHIAQGNGIVSSILSNWHFLSLTTSNTWDSLWGEARLYGNCSCGINSTCTIPAFIDEWRVPGFLVGCYPLDALLQSTLECLYDIVCIDKLKNIYEKMSFTIRPLNFTLSDPKATVQSLVNTLLIDRWKSNISYDQYYASCKPLSCSYSIIEQANLLYTISTIIGLFGGLSVVLKLIIPVAVNIGQHIIMYHRRRRVQPTVSIIVIPE